MEKRINVENLPWILKTPASYHYFREISPEKENSRNYFVCYSFGTSVGAIFKEQRRNIKSLNTLSPTVDIGNFVNLFFFMVKESRCIESTNNNFINRQLFQLISILTDLRQHCDDTKAFWTNPPTF